MEKQMENVMETATTRGFIQILTRNRIVHLAAREPARLRQRGPYIRDYVKAIQA